VHETPHFFRNSYGPVKFIEVENFNALYAEKSTKISDMFKGGKKTRQAATVFIDRFCLLLFRAFI
jgi:hypothetical protein